MINDRGTIKNALAWALDVLKKEPAEAHLEAEILLAYVVNKNRAYLFSYPEKELTLEQKTRYQQLISQRVEGVPIAYLTQEREFWSLSLTVNEHTLIPRHETELIVELALTLLSATKPLTILDLGTGSGAIALALAKERPLWHIAAVDKSKEALAVAQANAHQLQLKNVTFYHSHWFTSLPNKHYDAIIANPPYIAEHDPHLKIGDVRFEPISALVSPEQGLADLRHIITHSKDYLVPKGLLLLEHGYDQKNSVEAILNKLGYCTVQSWQDITGHDRVSGGWRSE